MPVERRRSAAVAFLQSVSASGSAEQAADRIPLRQASISRSTHSGWIAQRAASWTRIQSSVRAPPRERLETGGHGRRACRAAAAHGAAAHPFEVRHVVLEHPRSSGASTTRSARCRHPCQRRERVRDHRAAGDRHVLLGQAGPERAPAPAHGRARTGAGCRVGHGAGGWLEGPSVGQGPRTAAYNPGGPRHAASRSHPRPALACRDLPGSADALLLAQFAMREAAAGRVTAIVTAEPADTQRLEQELPFFAPGLRIAVFRLGDAALTASPHPGPDLGAARDLVADPGGPARPRRGARPGVDRARTRLAPPSFLAAYTFHFRQKTRLDEAALKAQLTLPATAT